MPALVLDAVSRQLSLLPTLVPLFKSARLGDNIAAGSSTATAVSAWITSSPSSGVVSAAGTAAGVAIISAGGAPSINTAAGSAAGAATVSAGGSHVGASAGSAAGSSTGAAYSPRLRSTVNGTSTVTGVSNAILAGSGTLAAAGAAAGTSSPSGVSSSVFAGTGSSAGVATATATGGLRSSVGTAAGAGTAAGVGLSLVAGMGSPITTVSFAQDLTFVAPRDVARISILQDSVVYNGETLQAAYFGGAVQLRGNTGTWSTLRTIADITEFSVVYDNRLWPVLAYVQSGVAYVSWKNDLSTWVDVALGSGAAGPFVAVAGAAVSRIDSRSVVVAYLQGGYLYSRSSYDNYSTATQLAPIPATSTRVKRAGMSTTDEFLVELDGVSRITTAVTTELITDTMYAVASDDLFPMFDAAITTGEWKSKRFVVNGFPAFGWGRLEGPFVSATMRLYADGALRYETPLITDTTPFRLPPGRCREIEIELEGTGRVTGVTLATTADEMEAA